MRRPRQRSPGHFRRGILGPEGLFSRSRDERSASPSTEGFDEATEA